MGGFSEIGFVVGRGGMEVVCCCIEFGGRV